MARALATARVLRSLFVYVSAQGMCLCVEMASLARELIACGTALTLRPSRVALLDAVQ